MNEIQTPVIPAQQVTEPIVVTVGRDIHAQDYATTTAGHVIVGGNPVYAPASRGAAQAPVVALAEHSTETPDNDPELFSLFDTHLVSEIADNPRFLRAIAETVREIRDAKRNGGSEPQVVISPYFRYGKGREGVSGLDVLAEELGAIVLGPSEELVEQYSDKLFTYKQAQELGVPVAPGGIVGGKEGLRQFAREKLDRGDGYSFFASSGDDPFGPVTRHITSLEQVEAMVNAVEGDCDFLVTDWIPQEEIECSPNTQVIIGDHDIVFLGCTDQIIRDGVRYFGNRYPSTANAEQLERIKQHTLRMAKAMQEAGYRGISGFDWIALKDGREFFAETNPRKNRSTGTLATFVDRYRSDGAPSVVEMEIAAATGQRLDPGAYALPPDVHWAMELVKEPEGAEESADLPPGQVKVVRKIVPAFSDAELPNQPAGSTSILHVPVQGYKGKAADYARIITIGSSDEQVDQELAKARKEVGQAFVVARR